MPQCEIHKKRIALSVSRIQSSVPSFELKFEKDAFYVPGPTQQRCLESRQATRVYHQSEFDKCWFLNSLPQKVWLMKKGLLDECFLL